MNHLRCNKKKQIEISTIRCKIMARNSFLTAIFIILNAYRVCANPAVFDSVKCHKACQTPSTTDGKTNVHLVPHSHDDVGWLSTVDQYYDGSGEGIDIAQASVKSILATTIAALQENETRRYVQVETTFFWKWWQEQSNETKQAVIDLVNNGRLEMINGALSMNDEADTNYQSIIDQFTWGLQILDSTVGPCGRPKIGWQIDPFGHSREHASILKQMGFEGLVIGRIDHSDKTNRISKKELDFMWKTSNTLKDSEIFTTIFPNFYTYETGFCFDILSSCNNTMTDDMVAKFKTILNNYKDYYKTPNILIPMGGDFTYQNATNNFENTDKLIEGFKKDDSFNVFYSTPSCYIEAVQTALTTNTSIKLPTKDDDFFPYASDDHSYWAGYFTSRPTVKRFERVANNILQSVKQLMSFSRMANNNKAENEEKLNDLRIAMGILQHHDAITGTEKQKVANDYVFKLHNAIKNLEEPVGKIVANLLKKSGKKVLDLKLTNCLLANVSICSTSGKDKFLTVIQNPLSRAVDHYVRLPVDGTDFKITGSDGEVSYDVFDAISDFAYVKETEKPKAKELVFKAKQIPPLGISVYYVEKLNSTNATNYHKFEEFGTDDETFFGINGTNGFEIETSSKQLKSIVINKQSLPVTQEFLYYDGFTSATCNTNDAQRCSGAYIFRPVDEAKTIDYTNSAIQFAKGSLVHEVRQQISDEVTQIIRIYLDQTYVEFDWLVGNLKNDTNKGREIITRYTVNNNFKNSNVFYTDSNGREQIERTINNKTVTEPIASNYYPVTSRIVIRDDANNKEVAVLNDRAQGGSSLNDGEIELMVHRRLFNDDGFGVDEPLNELEYGEGLHARGHHYLTFGSTTTADFNGLTTAAYERELAHQKLLAPWVLLADATEKPLNTLKDVQNAIQFTYKPLSDDYLNGSVQILTLEPWTDSYLLRLEHILENGDAQTVQFNELFAGYRVSEYAETKLAANFIGENDTVDWNAVKADNNKISLGPMQIKTILFKPHKVSGSESLTATAFLVLLMAFIYTIV